MGLGKKCNQIMISETSKWNYQRERALIYSVVAENTKNGTKSPFFMICFSLPLSISSHLKKEKPTHTQLHTQQLKVQKKRNPKYPYQQMKRRNQENHKEVKFRESKYFWYELREKPKPQTRLLIRIIVEIALSSRPPFSIQVGKALFSLSANRVQIGERNSKFFQLCYHL